jgi:TetR/AcrR family transcriptional repressor of nem operon
MATERYADVGTATRILDVAEGLVQVRGFNAFSYADIAAELKLTKAGLHYHFPGKAELGLALVSRYSARFQDSLGDISAEGLAPLAQLEAYVDLYAGVVAAGRMCLCGMLAADYPTLPAPMQSEVRLFIDANQRWLAAVLEAGAADGSLRVTESSADSAMMVIAGLEGAMLVARPYGDVGRFRSAAAQLLAGIASAPGSAGR